MAIIQRSANVTFDILNRALNGEQIVHRQRNRITRLSQKGIRSMDTLLVWEKMGSLVPTPSIFKILNKREFSPVS